MEAEDGVGRRGSQSIERAFESPLQPANIACVRWLVHGNLTGAVAEALVRHGHVAQKPVDVGLPEGAPAAEVFEAANGKQLDILTNDAELVKAPFESAVKFGRSIVFLQLEGGDVEQDDAIDRLFKRYKRLTPGRLYTVTGSRVKIRQLPGLK
jgi:hypothetical protein